MDKDMTKVAIKNLGCKVNSYEADVMRQNLEENGFVIVPFDEIADIYLVNTCTVTNIADRKSRQMLARARHLNPQAIVVAVGCYVDNVCGEGQHIAKSEQIAMKSLVGEGLAPPASLFDLAIPNDQKPQLVPLLLEHLGKDSATATSPSLRYPPARTRAFIKIEDGCNQFCSYCIVPYVRGRVRSRPAAAIETELTELVNQGCAEAVLTGINLSAYGTDLGEKDALPALLERLAALPGLLRLRLSSLAPQLVTRAFAERIAAIDKVCPHFHLSLQSGCDATLARMNRCYSAAEYWEKVEILRAAYSDPALTTDVIVGFPGETEAEFAETEAFLQRVAFAEMHVFPYSKREGTAAAALPGQIPANIKKERANRLLQLNDVMSQEFRRRFVGKKCLIILEDRKTIDGETYWLGYTPEYIRVAVRQADFVDCAPQSGMAVEVEIGVSLSAPMFFRACLS
jgi:threonylcarbamoyladenosine tRNA methylthiotransferase MtaB